MPACRNKVASAGMGSWALTHLLRAKERLDMRAVQHERATKLGERGGTAWGLFIILDPA